MIGQRGWNSELPKRFMVARKFVAGVLGWGDYQAAAAELNISVDTLRRDIRRAKQHERFDAWRPRQRGRKPGSTKFPSRVHQIVEREAYKAAKHPQNYALTAREVEGALIAEGLPAEQIPSLSSTSRLLRSLEAGNFAHFQRARHGRHGEHKTALQRGVITAGRPLEIVMIDHTILDAQVWFDIGDQRVAIRPTFTAAKDVCTGVVLAAFLSPQRPSASTVALAMALISVPKTNLLRQHDLPGSWEACGIPLTVLADGEFRSDSLQRALAQWGGELIIGPPGKPNKRPHIERQFGISKELVHRLPGATLSNPQHLEAHGGRRSPEITFEQAQRALLNIVTTHNNETYGGDKPPPLARWEAQINQRGVLAQAPVSPFETFIHFLPRRFPKVQYEGLKLLSGIYRSPAIAPLRFEGVKQVEVAFDPRDISQVWLVRDGQTPVAVPRVVNKHAPKDRYAYAQWLRGERRAAKALRDNSLLSALKVARDVNHLWQPRPEVVKIAEPAAPVRIAKSKATDSRRFDDFRPTPIVAHPMGVDAVALADDNRSDADIIIPTYQWWSR